MLTLFLDSSEGIAAVKNPTHRRLSVKFDPPVRAVKLALEKVTLLNARITEKEIPNTLYLCCDSVHPNIYNGRPLPVIFSIYKSARTTEWENKLATWTSNLIDTYDLWQNEHTNLSFWLMDADQRVISFEYMALTVKLMS